MNAALKNVTPGERPGEYVIKPDPVKWYLTSAVTAVFPVMASRTLFSGDTMSGFVVAAMIAMSIYSFLMARGIAGWIRIDSSGLEYQYLFGRRKYDWTNVSDFRVHPVGVGLNRQKMVAFDRLDKTGAFAALNRAVAKGTENMPVIGLPADDLVAFLNAQRAFHLGQTSTGRMMIAQPHRDMRQKPLIS